MDILQGIIWLLVVFLSIAFHEYSHGWAANQLGDDTAERMGRLTLNPVKHIDPIGSVILPLFLYISGSPFLFGWAKPVPYNPANLSNKKWGDALVAVAGPASNMLIAVFAAVAFRIVNTNGWGGIDSVASAAFNATQFFALLAIINISLAIFNLIPIPPLDGSKILSAVLPEVGQRLFYALERIGPIFVFIVFIFAFSAIAPILGKVIFTIFRFLVGI